MLMPRPTGSATIAALADLVALSEAGHLPAKPASDDSVFDGVGAGTNRICIRYAGGASSILWPRPCSAASE